jgi:nicotinamidase-related amidase
LSPIGSEANELVLQLRKCGIDKVILVGASANLCVESHMRELLEQGFEVAVLGPFFSRSSSE